MISRYTVTLVVSVVINLLLAGALLREALTEDDGQVYGDHVQQIRMDVANQVLRVRLGTSETTGGASVINPQPAGTIVLTPRAAIQLDNELRTMFAMIQRASAQTSPSGSGDRSQSPDPTL